MRVTLTFVVLQRLVFGIARVVCLFRGHDDHVTEIWSEGRMVVRERLCRRCDRVVDELVAPDRPV